MSRNQLKATIVYAEKIKTHGGSIRVCIKKGKNLKVDKSVKNIIEEEIKFGLDKYDTYKKFGEKVYDIRSNVIENIKKLNKKYKKIVGYGSPAKATTALNFFGISQQIDFIIEDNALKHGKFIPGVKIPIVTKPKKLDNKTLVLVLAWNFFEEIKKNNDTLSTNFINIKSLETNKN